VDEGGIGLPGRGFSRLLKNIVFRALPNSAAMAAHVAPPAAR
jgi:hypothetical protein